MRLVEDCAAELRKLARMRGNDMTANMLECCASEIDLYRWENEALIKELRQAVTLFEGDDECQTLGTDACVWLYDARTALSKAGDGS